MKEDILEQLVEDWLLLQGYFTRANVKYGPLPQDEGYNVNLHQIGSDIDVIGYHPGLEGRERVITVNCKSWQDPFPVRGILHRLTQNPNSKINGKECWKHFRELKCPIWNRAFLRKVRDVTHHSGPFTHVTAVTLIEKPEHRSLWESHQTFVSILEDSHIQLIDLNQMLSRMLPDLGTTVESSQFSRTLQLFKAAGIGLDMTTIKPTPSEE